MQFYLSNTILDNTSDSNSFNSSLAQNEIVLNSVIFLPKSTFRFYHIYNLIKIFKTRILSLKRNFWIHIIVMRNFEKLKSLKIYHRFNLKKCTFKRFQNTMILYSTLSFYASTKSDGSAGTNTLHLETSSQTLK